MFLFGFLSAGVKWFIRVIVDSITSDGCNLAKDGLGTTEVEKYFAWGESTLIGVIGRDLV